MKNKYVSVNQSSSANISYGLGWGGRQGLLLCTSITKGTLGQTVFREQFPRSGILQFLVRSSISKREESSGISRNGEESSERVAPLFFKMAAVMGVQDNMIIPFLCRLLFLYYHTLPLCWY